MGVAHRHYRSALLASLILGAPTAQAGPCLDIALLPNGATAAQRDDLTDRLLMTGRIRSVATQSNARLLDDTTPYAVLLVIWVSPPDTPQYPFRQIYGDALAEFIDDGGAAVITQFGITDYIGPGGAFRDTYLPLSSECHLAYGSEAGIVEPVSFPGDSPFFHQVETLTVSRYTRTSCYDYTIRPTATVHASLPDGRPLVVSEGPVVAVNINFMSDAVRGSGYASGDDYPELFVNALYLATGLDPTTACNGDTDDDGLSDDEETTLGTDPERADTDDDGLVDSIDNCPLHANPDQADDDGDGLGDLCDEDPEPDTEVETEVDTEADDDTEARQDNDACTGCSTPGGVPMAIPLVSLLGIARTRRRPRRAAR